VETNFHYESKTEKSLAKTTNRVATTIMENRRTAYGELTDNLTALENARLADANRAEGRVHPTRLIAKRHLITVCENPTSSGVTERLV
jgi:hypothetical protein